MSKVVLSVAQKIAQLRVIPQQLCPSTLKHRILVPKLTEIKFEYSKSIKEFGPMFQFYRKYVADLRFHNPELIIRRLLSEEGPLVGRIILLGKNTKEGDEVIIESNKVKTVEELKEKIIQLHNQMI